MASVRDGESSLVAPEIVLSSAMIQSFDSSDMREPIDLEAVEWDELAMSFRRSLPVQLKVPFWSSKFIVATDFVSGTTVTDSGTLETSS
jgi:hypothetical protein